MVAIKKDQEEGALHTEAVHAGSLGYTKLNELNLPTEVLVHPLQTLFCAVLSMFHFARLRPKTTRETIPTELPQLANKVAELF